jgi:hypothetical protein
MVRRLFWPLLWVLLLEGFFLNLSLGWMVAAAAIALFGYLACEAIRAHRALDDIIARMNAEIAARAEQADNPDHPVLGTASLADIPGTLQVPW